MALTGTTQVSWYQKGKTNLDFTEVRDGEWQWHQLGHMQICTALQTDNHASTPPLSFLQAGCPSCHPTNSIKALKARNNNLINVWLYISKTQQQTTAQVISSDQLCCRIQKISLIVDMPHNLLAYRQKVSKRWKIRLQKKLKMLLLRLNTSYASAAN